MKCKITNAALAHLKEGLLNLASLKSLALDFSQ